MLLLLKETTITTITKSSSRNLIKSLSLLNKNGLNSIKNGSSIINNNHNNNNRKKNFSTLIYFNNGLLTNKNCYDFSIIQQKQQQNQQQQLRTFSSSQIILKKGGGGGGAGGSKKGSKKNNNKSNEEKTNESSSSNNNEGGIETIPENILDIPSIQKQMDSTLLHFKERVNIIKQGTYTPSIIEEIQVSTAEHTIEPIKNIARVTLKGPRNMIVTVFNPSNSKHIISAVLGSNLNLNPQPDPKQDQVLRIPLPPSTSESRKEIIKRLKLEFEHCRNSPAKRSLTSIREEAMKVLKKYKSVTAKDESFALKNKLEDLFKNNANKLADLLKQAEASAMKE